jgi:phospholipase D1/2
MFVPEANRLCKFLEISALSLALANRGGFQGKQGYLRIMSNGAFSRRQRTGFHAFKFKGRREPKWFIVRESYLISVDEPDQTEIYDIFLVDDEFQLKRPTRLLKQGIHLLDWHDASKEQHAPALNFENEVDPNHSTPGNNPSGSGDPDEGVTAELAADSRQVQHASSHVFYITNSEREVKLIAKNERQMDQFIASIERMVARSIWHGKNRFGSYAPIRMNVSAQWLIDGRDYFWNLSKAILLAKERIYIHDWWLVSHYVICVTCDEVCMIKGFFFCFYCSCSAVCPSRQQQK